MEALQALSNFRDPPLASGIKERKVQYALDYLRMLGASGLVFAGISGSVSYEPKEDDDVDIFLIAKDGRLWEVLFRALINRRFLKMHDICLSLCMSESYASDYYSCITDPLIVDDAGHVIPVYGQEYYRKLLSTIGGKRFAQERGKTRTRWDPGSIVSGAMFLFLGPYTLMKGFVANHRLRAGGRSAETFTTMISRNYFVLDSEKYRALRRMRSQGGEFFD